jgi:hypothetical protein
LHGARSVAGPVAAAHRAALVVDPQQAIRLGLVLRARGGKSASTARAPNACACLEEVELGRRHAKAVKNLVLPAARAHLHVRAEPRRACTRAYLRSPKRSCCALIGTSRRLMLLRAPSVLATRPHAVAAARTDSSTRQCVAAHAVRSAFSGQQCEQRGARRAPAPTRPSADGGPPGARRAHGRSSRRARSPMSGLRGW